MDAKTAVAIAALAVTMIVGFWKMANQLGRLELKIDLMWEAYVSERRKFPRRPQTPRGQPVEEH